MGSAAGGAAGSRKENQFQIPPPMTRSPALPPHRVPGDRVTANSTAELALMTRSNGSRPPHVPSTVDTASASLPARGPGRPQDAALDAAILAAAHRHLGELGYTGMSIQGVAAAAGTSVPALRRRYRGKPELAAATIDAMPAQPLPLKTAHPRADALAILNNLRHILTRNNGIAILATVITERTRHPELLAHFRQRIDEPRRQRLREALSRGRHAGQIPASLDLDTAVSILTGSLYAHGLKNQHIPKDWAEHTLRIIWPPPPQPGCLPHQPTPGIAGSGPTVITPCRLPQWATRPHRGKRCLAVVPAVRARPAWKKPGNLDRP